MNPTGIAVGTMAFSIHQLEVISSDRILELGFGGGITLPRLIEAGGFVVGLDPSQYLVRHAESKFSDAIENGKAAFYIGSVEALPFESSSFEKIITVNTVYFWNSLLQAFGRSAVYLRQEAGWWSATFPKNGKVSGNSIWLKTEIFRSYPPADQAAVIECLLKSNTSACSE